MMNTKKTKKKKKEFIVLFKECYNDIVKIMELYSHKRVAVNCFMYIKGMDLSKLRRSK